MKFKIKCRTKDEYDSIKRICRYEGIAFKQKEGKSLKVDCNKNELLYYLNMNQIQPISIKPCKSNKSPNMITGYSAINRNDGFGLVEQYDLISELNNMLPLGGIHCADDIKEYKSMMRLMDPSGLTRTVFEHNDRSFVGDNYRLCDDYDEDYDM